MGKKSNITERYKDLLNFVENNSYSDLEDKKVYNNFISLLHNKLVHDKNFDIDILDRNVICNIEINKANTHVNYKEEVNNLISSIKDDFKKNIATHYLFCPLQGSYLKEDIINNDIILLTKVNDKENYFNKLAKTISIPVEQLKFFLEHTINSRSKNFLDSNMLIVRLEANTSYVRRYASEIIQDIFDFIRLIHTAYEEEDFLIKYSAMFDDSNQHVAIFSEEEWRCGHGYSWDAFLTLKKNLDFLNNSIYKELLIELLSVYTFDKTKSKNEVAKTIYNSIKIFNRGLKYERSDIEVCNLLLLTACEAVLTQNKNEKRLRLSVLIPKILGLYNEEKRQSSLIINNLYKSRNNFVHSGYEMKVTHEEKDIDLAKPMYAKILVKLLQHVQEHNITTMNELEKYLNELFEEAIYS
ncbi:hypothetical protein CW685_11975 [Macrococcoides caseolyticum]|uniref:HEPN domain-containing protein n=1 Tax=Macrococcoides caseolyticum TaxID=69966 RepID=UPI000C321B83|nr:HEPN domain-containing protein [Macrococcus caseolyticus]PKE09589.1 hypothetical protein CW685_11975 [Macrococcus caseolyticus]